MSAHTLTHTGWMIIARSNGHVVITPTGHSVTTANDKAHSLLLLLSAAAVLYNNNKLVLILTRHTLARAGLANRPY